MKTKSEDLACSAVYIVENNDSVIIFVVTIVNAH
jgi:hypothetical protein